MKKDFNKMTTNDMPMDDSFTPVVERVNIKRRTEQPKIKPIGKNTENKINKKTTSQNLRMAEDKNYQIRKSKEKKDLIDLEKMNEENIKSYRFKSKRNKVVIVLLSVMLVIAISSIAIYLVIVGLQSNCELYVHGADASFIVDGEQLNSFRAPSNIQGGSILEIEIELKLEDSGQYNILFFAKCYQKGVLMNNTLIYNKSDLFYDGGIYDENDGGRCYSRYPISGKQTIRLCGGIIIDREYENSLNVDNFRMEFHVYLEKV